MPPMMVAPEREVPGISAKHCATPTLRASSQVIACVLSTRATRLPRSTSRMTMPPAMNAMATGTGPNSCALMKPPNSRPSTAAGRNATSRLRQSCRSTLKNRVRYSHTTASIAPVWIAT
jgi:hypothetical protein